MGDEFVGEFGDYEDYFIKIYIYKYINDEIDVDCY